MIRVVIADDESLVRAGIRAILASDAQIEVVAEAVDGAHALEQIRRHEPDGLVDIRMPNRDGLSVAAAVRDSAATTKVVILTTFADDDHIARAIAAGADGFLVKASDPGDLTAGVRAVAGGGAVLSPAVAKRVLAGLRTEPRAGRTAARQRVAALTEREQQVLLLVGRGLSNAEIARRLHLVEGTVKGYVSAILERLGAANRVQAALVAFEAGLVDDADG